MRCCYFVVRVIARSICYFSILFLLGNLFLFCYFYTIYLLQLFSVVSLRRESPTIYPMKFIFCYLSIIFFAFCFCSDATLVQKICSSKVSGKITSSEKNCYDALIVLKNALTSPMRSSARFTLFLLQTVFDTMKQKRGIFLLHGSNFGILVRNIFAPFI
jgi:hypothetical protein